MKKVNIFLSIAVMAPSILSGSSFREVALVASSIVAAYPMVKHAYTWSKTKSNRDMLISTLEDVDPVVEKYVRDQLRSKKYAIADTLPIKTYDGSFYMEIQLDGCLVFSESYQAELKDVLSKNLDEAAQQVLGNLQVNLDHEMFHLQEQHVQQSIGMKIAIPVLAEIALLPLTSKLLAVQSALLFVGGLVATIPAKQCIYTHLENAHRKYQERNADDWALKKNSSVDDLKAFMNFRRGTVRRGFTGLYTECSKNGYSQSKLFNALVKLFPNSVVPVDEQRLETDQEYAEQYWATMQHLYKRFKQQPWQWPLRLLAYSFDPHHPFALDDVHRTKQRIKELERITD